MPPGHILGRQRPGHRVRGAGRRGRTMVKDFKAFILRGSVVDLAVGIVIGAAFTAVVTAFVANLLTPLIAIPGKTNFSTLEFTVHGSQFHYGLFVNALISFLLVSAAV